MKHLLVSLAVLATAATLFSAVNPAYGCSCATQPLHEKIRFYEAIVLGTVTELFDSTQGRAPDLDAKVQVETYYKGGGSEEITVDDPISSADCGYFDEGSIGQRYLLFLSKDGLLDDGSLPPRDEFHTHLCAGNVLLSGHGDATEAVADQAIAVLEAHIGPGHAPTVPPDDLEFIRPRPFNDGEIRAELEQGPTGVDHWLATDSEDGDAPTSAMWAGAVLLPIVFLALAVIAPWRRG